MANISAKLTTRRVKRIVDLAAKADIEDVFLQDLHGLSTYLKLQEDLVPTDIPRGRKGSARLKQLFIQLRNQGRTTMFYHKGERARELINCLNFETIIQSSILPLNLLEMIFEP